MTLDRIITWAEQGGRDGVRTWCDDDAIAVGTPDLFRRDRLAVAGPAGPVAALVETALGELGPTYRVFGETALVEQVAHAVPGLEVVGHFGWMDALKIDDGNVSEGAVGEGTGDERTSSAVKPRWLDPDEYAEVNAILDAAFPDSYARPGLPGVLRWAGVRDDSGALVAIAADAWSAPGIGFMSGVATDPAARGRGYGEAVCRFTLRELIADHGRAALSVDGDNYPAIRVYRRLGLDWGDVAVARVAG